MTYDLIVWPVSRALTLEEAVAELDAIRGMRPFGFGHDKRLDPFLTALEKRHPGVRGRGAEPPFELDVMRSHIFVGIPWNSVAAVVQDVADAAWTTGLAVYDPQRAAVGLPAPLAPAPMTADGVEPHVRAAGEAFAAIQDGVAGAPGDDDAAMTRSVSGRLAAAGFTEMSPLGFEITPELADEVFADPLRVPSALQTEDRKVKLIADMAASMPGARHLALGQLAGWDPDDEVAAVLRPVLASEDVFEASTAARGLARQADITDLPAVLGLVHRMSPADGGTTEAMLMPLRAALDLAALAGPTAIEGVRARARTWRGAAPVRRQSWERELDRELEQLLGGS